jgi:hypothetical protein
LVRIVTTHYRCKRPPRKRKAVALEMPAVVAREGSRRLGSDKTPAEVGVKPRHSGEAVHSVAQPAANDDGKPAIVTTTNRKRLKAIFARVIRRGGLCLS